MKKTTALYLASVILLFIHGCSSTGAYRKDVMKPTLNQELNASNLSKNQPEPAIKTIEVSAENFKINTNVIPDKENIKQVKILGAQLNDVIALLTEATNQNIIFQLQSSGTTTVTNGQVQTDNTNDVDTQIKDSKVYVSASNIGFGRLLKKAVGDKLSIRYDDETYYLGYVKTVTLKIPSLKGLAAELKKTLKSLGAMNVVEDSITSSVTFSAREKEYVDIMKYLTILRNNLYVIEYDIAIYNVQLKDSYSLGINWDLMPKGDNTFGLISTVTSAFGAVGAGLPPNATFGTLLNNKDYSASVIAKALSNFGKVESIQKPKLLGIAGTDVTLVDGLEEPYIKELSTTAVGNNGVQTATTSASALSGLKVTLNSNIMDGTIITDISLDINDIDGYSSFTVNDTSYSQPRVHTKHIKNNMRVQPGVPIVISGLFKNTSDKGYQGLPGAEDSSMRLLGGSEYDGNNKTEMVIIVTPRVIKYVMK